MFRGLNDESMITSQGGIYSVNVSSDLLSLYLKRPGCKIVYKGLSCLRLTYLWGLTENTFLIERHG